MFYGSDNFSVGVGLSVASPPSSHYSSRYMADQTFHTPNFGDEEFDIPPINFQQQSSHDPNNTMHHMNYSMGMHGNHQQQPQHLGQQQQQHYSTMYIPEGTPMTMNSPSVAYGGSPPTYTTLTLSSPHSHSQQQHSHSHSHSPMGSGPGQHMMHSQQQHPHHQQQPSARPLPPPPPHPHPHQQQQQHHPQQQQKGGMTMSNVAVPLRRSPSNNSTSPPTNPESHSDDSDDSVPQGVGGVTIKRPSPEPDRGTTVAAPKKQKAQKKKKKRDPNEPQKPVSAYALFFRDTQAAIKGQNPNASFGDVSKIVASMWDALDSDHKNVYKKKTEAAKKEYLKALAAYRASLVSKGAPTESPDGTGLYPPPNFGQNMNNNISPQQQYQHPQQQQGQTQTYYGNQPPQQTAVQVQVQVAPHKKSPTAQQPGTVGNQPSGGGHSIMHAGHHHDQQQQQAQYGHNPPQYMSTMGDGHGGMPQGNQGGGGSGMNSQLVVEGQAHHPQRQLCVRHGCGNVASTPQEADMAGYDEGYCSSQCVVTHCRDVFNNWVTTNQGAPPNPNYGM